MAKVYADNYKNRKLGRAGKPYGSMPVSEDGMCMPAKNYADTSLNRSLGRVGLEHGSMVVTKEDDYLKVIVQIILASYSHSSCTIQVMRY